MSYYHWQFCVWDQCCSAVQDLPCQGYPSHWTVVGDSWGYTQWSSGELELHPEMVEQTHGDRNWTLTECTWGMFSNYCTASWPRKWWYFYFIYKFPELCLEVWISQPKNHEISEFFAYVNEHNWNSLVIYYI